MEDLSPQQGPFLSVVDLKVCSSTPFPQWLFAPQKFTPPFKPPTSTQFSLPGLRMYFNLFETQYVAFFSTGRALPPLVILKGESVQQ